MIIEGLEHDLNRDLDQLNRWSLLFLGWSWFYFYRYFNESVSINNDLNWHFYYPINVDWLLDSYLNWHFHYSLLRHVHYLLLRNIHNLLNLFNQH